MISLPVAAFFFIFDLDSASVISTTLVFTRILDFPHPFDLLACLPSRFLNWSNFPSVSFLFLGHQLLLNCFSFLIYKKCFITELLLGLNEILISAWHIVTSTILFWELFSLTLGTLHSFPTLRLIWLKHPSVCGTRFDKRLQGWQFNKVRKSKLTSLDTGPPSSLLLWS